MDRRSEESVQQNECVPYYIPSVFKQQFTNFQLLYYTCISSSYIASKIGEPTTKFLIKAFSPDMDFSKKFPGKAESFFSQELCLLQALQTFSPRNSVKIYNYTEDNFKKRGYVRPYYVKKLADLRKEQKSINIEQFILDVTTCFVSVCKSQNISCLNLTPQCIGYIGDEGKFVIYDWEKVIRYHDKSNPNFDAALVKILKKDSEAFNYLAPEIKESIEYPLTKPLGYDIMNFGYSLGMIILEILGDTSLLNRNWSSEQGHPEEIQKILSKIKTTNKVKELLSKILSFKPESRFTADQIISFMKQEQDYIEIERLDDEISKIISKKKTSLKSYNGYFAKNSDEIEKSLAAINYMKVTSDESYYRGLYFNGKRSGLGENLFPDETYYIGNWENDVPSGKGCMVDRFGNLYEGNWKNGVMHDNGEYVWVNESQRYNGNFNNGRIAGYGTLYFDKVSQKGEWGKWENGILKPLYSEKIIAPKIEINSLPPPYMIKLDQKSISKTFQEERKSDKVFQNGSIHRESPSNYILSGFHHCTYENGNEYKGDWKNGKWHGKGIWTKAGGQSYYDGNYEDGVRNGTGKMKYQNGDHYDGGWKNGKKNGKGLYIWSGVKSKYNGDWVDDKREGHGEMTYENGDSYKGYWKDDLFEGKGEYCWKDGRKYTGDFKAGKKHGEGKMQYVDGDEYDGEWKNDNYDGKGVYSTERKNYDIKSVGGNIVEITELV